MKKGIYTESSDFLPYYRQQHELSKRAIRHDEIADDIRLIGGADVAYRESEDRMVGAIVVLDSQTLQVVASACCEMEITFPYVPGLFSFREVPALVQAFGQLEVKPQVIVCDGHGIAHPKKIGMATHLGIELDIPTIGCAKSRLVGSWNKDELKLERGSSVPLAWENEIVGNVLRTQTGIKPVFVSIGHKVSLQTATSMVLHLASKYRLPETTRQSDQLVNRRMKD
jgi:deoxyribonuclease V